VTPRNGRATASTALRFQVRQRLAALAVERGRVVLVRDLPPAAGLPQADGGAHPAGLLLTLVVGAAAMADIAAEGDVAAGLHVELVHLERHLAGAHLHARL